MLRLGHSSSSSRGAEPSDSFLPRPDPLLWRAHGRNDALAPVLGPNCCSVNLMISVSVLLVFCCVSTSGETRLGFCEAYEAPVPETVLNHQDSLGRQSGSTVVLQGVAGTQM